MRLGGLPLALALAGCTLVTGLPSVEPEESAAACANGTDDDLDGAVDCADDSCHAFCWDGSLVVAPAVTECFSDGPLGLAFRVVDTDGRHQRCEPDPDPAQRCGGGEHRVPGAIDCRPPGAACPEGEWPAVTEGGVPLLHVRPGATGGDGSEAAPFGTIAEALAVAPLGARVLLARGEHDAPGELTRRVELRGACANETTVRGPLVVEADGVVLSNLRLVAGDAGHALEVHAATDADGLRVEGTVWVEGARLALTDAMVIAGEGVAVTARDGARLELVEVTASGESGVDVEASTLWARSVAIRETVGTGLRLGAGASTDEAAGLVLEPAAGVGVELACDEGAERCAELEDLIVRFPAGLPASGRGVVARSGHARLRRAYLARTLQSGLDVEAAVVELEDSTVEAAEAGGGIRVGPDGEVLAVRVFLRNDRPRGLVVEEGGRFTSIDLDVLGSDRTATGDICVEAAEGSSLWMTRFVLESCGVCGLRVDRGVDLVLRDGLIARSSRGACIGRGAEYAVGELTSTVSYRDNISVDLYQE
ncbi:MAG: hypothetical protein H6719_11990 [Sandaracinaceae bacterium]|nr:hypothetical protein [Sandaracinaceae bacterium]